MLLTTIIGYCITHKYIKNYLYVKIQGIILSLIFIPVFFYTYTKILGSNIIILDILSFVVAIIIGNYFSYKRFNIKKYNNYFSIQIIIFLILCFSIFTFYPPHINLFKDSIHNTYGIKK